jgi:hypothetical protein
MRGQAVTLARRAYGSAVEMIVVSPVLKLPSNATTGDRFQLIRINSHISLIEQPMRVASQKQTILEFMPTTRAVRLDVRSL